MEIILWIFVWYVVGVLGSAMSMEFAYRREGYDINIGDIIFELLIAIAGPISLSVGVIFLAGYLLKKRVDTSRVVFRRAA